MSVSFIFIMKSHKGLHPLHPPPWPGSTTEIPRLLTAERRQEPRHQQRQRHSRPSSPLWRAWPHPSSLTPRRDPRGRHRQRQPSWQGFPHLRRRLRPQNASWTRRGPPRPWGLRLRRTSQRRAALRLRPAVAIEREQRAVRHDDV